MSNLIFLASKLELLTINKIWSFLPDLDFKEMGEMAIKQIYLNFDRRKTLRKSTITFNYRIVDGHIEFPYYMLLFDKSNKQSTKLETAGTWSKSNLNIMNIYEEKYHQFLDMDYPGGIFKLFFTQTLTNSDTGRLISDNLGLFK